MIISITMILVWLFLMKTQNEISELYQNEERFSWNTNTKNKKKYSQKEIEDLLKDQLWIKEKEASQLFSSIFYYSKKGVLHDLREEVALLYSPVPNQWLIDHELDYSNPNTLNEDPDNDGFTNLEEWEGDDPYQSPGTQSSDPNNFNSHPLFWTKLRCNASSLHKNNYTLDFLGSEEYDNKVFFKIQPQTPILDKNAQGKIILTKKIKYLKLGEKIAELPISLSSYSKKEIIYKNITYDISELTLKNIATGESWILVKKSSLHPKSSLISIIDAITFDYILKSPEQKIYVTNGSLFSLDNLEATNSESYQLTQLNSKEALIERNGHHYSIPITNEF